MPGTLTARAPHRARDPFTEDEIRRLAPWLAFARISDLPDELLLLFAPALKADVLDPVLVARARLRTGLDDAGVRAHIVREMLRTGAPHLAHATIITVNGRHMFTHPLTTVADATSPIATAVAMFGRISMFTSPITDTELADALRVAR